MEQIDGKTRLVALLGDPVGHTRSPLIHNTAFERQRINCRYVACRVPPGHLRDAVRGLVGLDFLGANVTIPHKERVRDHLDEVSDRARAVGAVNTIVCRRSDTGTVNLFGDNTDVEGFLAPLLSHLGDLRGERAVVLGSGGSARAVVHGLLTATLVTKLGGDLDFHASYAARGNLPMAEHVIRESRLVVNTTPLGMSPDVNRSPWGCSEDFMPGQIVYDLVYNPVQTLLLQEAASRDAVTIDGLEMLIAQAAASYRQWTGRDMPSDDIRSLLLQS